MAIGLVFIGEPNGGRSENCLELQESLSNELSLSARARTGRSGDIKRAKLPRVTEKEGGMKLALSGEN